MKIFSYLVFATRKSNDMKKLMISTLTLLAMSCSSDSIIKEVAEDEKDIELKQYKVDYTISKKELEKQADGNHVNIPSSNSSNNNLGLSGIYIVFPYRDIIGSEVTYPDECRAFDRSCPYEWNNTVHLYTQSVNHENRMQCPVCDSRYSTYDMKIEVGSSGVANRYRKLKMVQYKVDFDKEKQEYHITNPNYKK